MSSVEVVTPDLRRHKAKLNSWYVLHFMTWKVSESYNSLYPEAYATDDGSTRYRIRMPVLLSIVSTDDNEVLMDVSDVCKCHDVPFSRYLRIQMFLDGIEVNPPKGHAAPTLDPCLQIQNSWYVVYLGQDEADDYERLNPVRYRQKDGSECYKVRVPMLYRTADEKKPMDLGEVCRYLNIPDFRYQHFEMFIGGEEVEHAFNKAEERTYTLPVGQYFFGDPLSVLSDVEDFFDAFLGEHDCDEFFDYRGFPIVSIITGADGVYPLVERSHGTITTAMSGHSADIDSLSVELATASFIPLDLLASLGVKQELIEDSGFIFDSASLMGDLGESTFAVTIYGKGDVIQYVDFLRYRLLIDGT